MTTRLFSILLTITLGALALPAQATNWPEFGFVPSRSSFNAAEKTLTTGNVAKLKARWQISLGGPVADSSPILLFPVDINGVAHSMLYQTAKNGVTYGIDAMTGKILWRHGTGAYNGHNITTSTPVADPSGSAIYVPGVDGLIHKVSAATGLEVQASGFPARLTKLVQTEKDASSLNLANGYLYATTSGYNGDAPYYDGHVLSVRLRDGSTHVFNSLCSNVTMLPTSTFCSQSDSGIWGRGGAVVDPDPSMGGEVYAATGNGDFDANKPGGKNYGDTLLGLSDDVTTLIGHYTPKDFKSLDYNDIDMGSTSPAMLPRVNRSKTPLMAVQGGKDGTLRLIDRQHLPGVGGELQQITIASSLYSTPAVWTNGSGVPWVFIGLPDEIDAYRVLTNAQGASRFVGAWRSTAGHTYGEGTSPVIANGMVFVAMDGNLLALDATNGRTLWSSAMKSARKTIGPVHWESPIVVNGWVYCSDENGKITAYALPT